MARSDAHTQLDYAGEAVGKGTWAIPVPGKRTLETVFTEATLAGAGAYTASLAEDVWKARQLHIHVKWTAGATGSQISIIPEVSAGEQPSEGTWYAVGVTEAALTTGDVDSSISVANNGYDHDNFGQMDFQPLEIRFPAANNAGDVMRIAVTLDVSAAKFLRFRVAEVGTTGTPSDVEIKISKTA